MNSDYRFVDRENSGLALIRFEGGSSIHFGKIIAPKTFCGLSKGKHTVSDWKRIPMRRSGKGKIDYYLAVESLNRICARCRFSRASEFYISIIGRPYVTAIYARRKAL